MAIEDKYKQYAKKFGGFTPYNPPDRSYYRDLGYKAYQAKEAEKKAKNKTYTDALDLFSDPETKSAIKENGAAKEANEIRNDPIKQQQIKDAGFNVSDYIDAMYNAASDGKFRSEREYKEFGKSIPKATDQDASIEQKYGIKVDNTTQKEEKDDGLLSKLKSMFGGSEEKKKEDNQNSFLDDITTPLKQFGKGVKYTFDGDKNTSMSTAFEENVKKATETERSGITKELNRGAARIANTATLGTLDELYKKTNDGEQASQFKSREGGDAVADFLYDSAGYLVPGLGAANALRGTKLGADMSKKGVQKALQLGKEGAITGAGLGAAEVAIREGLNSEDYSAADNASLIGLGALGGAVADPALYGLGKAVQGGISKLAKGDVPEFTGRPSEDVLSKLPVRNQSSYTPSNNDLLDRLTQRGLRPPEAIKTEAEAITPKVEGNPFSESINDFNSAVEDQYSYLKDSLANRKGVQQGGVIRDEMGEVVDRYGRISENPQWYQEFYAQNGKAPNNTELRALAEEQVLNGFGDEFGQVPSWRPKEVEQIDNQIDEYNMLIESDPDMEEALSPLVRALEEEREGVLSQFNTARTSEPITPEEPRLIDRLKKANVTRERYEPITSGKEPSLKMLKPGEQPINREPIDIDDPKSLVSQQIDTSTNKEKKKWSFDHFMTAVVDDLRPLMKASKSLGANTLEANKNPYIQARLARGVSGKAETYLKGGMYNSNGEKVGKSLQEIVKPVEKNMDDFLSYITAKRALDYDEKGLTAGIKPKDVEGMSDRQLADATIKQIETPEFKEAHQQLVNYSHKLLDELADAGVLDKESVKRIREENPNYIPFQRVQDPSIRGFKPLAKNRYVNLGDAVKKRTGSERAIINPMESIIKNTYLMLNMAERNKVGRSLLNLVEESSDNEWARVVGKDKGVGLDEITNRLEEASQQIDEGKSEAIDDIFKAKDNKVYVYRDGERVEMEVQEDLYKALTSMDAQQSNFFIRMLSRPTSWLRQGAVLSPDFGPVNIFRDQFSAFVNSKYGFIPFVDMFSGMKNVLSKDDVYWKWKNAGGANSILATLDREYLQQDLRKMVNRPTVQKVKDFMKNPVNNSINAALTPLRVASEITEESTRVGEFKKGLKKGASLEDAAFASRDLIDFNRAGTYGRQLNQMTAFFNAAVQSMDKSARVFKENPKGASVRAMLSVTLPSIVAYMYNNNEEWYKEIPQRDRDLYWHFKLGDEIWKLPKPFELGVMFGTVPERILEFIKTEDPKAFKELDKTIKDTFTPPWMPTAAAPWVEVWSNKNNFNGSPIVPRREQDLLPEDQYGPYQSELSKALGGLTKQSPRNLEQVFRGYTGGLGGYFLQGTDLVAKAAGVEKAPKPDRGVADLPVVNRFVVKNLEGNNQSVNDFYNTLDKLRRESKSSKKNNIENPNEDVRKLFDKLQRDIGELQSDKREILESKNMSGQQKTEAIKEIDNLITRLAKVGLTNVN